MKGQIICHLGPPKTATTSMQIALNSINSSDFLFAGTFQPRDLNVGSLSHRLHEFCAEKVDFSRTDQIDLTREITEKVASGKTIFFSEEMFLVHQNHASIKEKINRLKEIFCSLPCRIVITVRNPRLALPSYYQEIFRSLPIGLQLDFSAFCRDQRAICYDYEELLKIINAAGFEDVKLIDFDALSAGNLDLGEILGKDEYTGTTLRIEKHNSGLIGSTPTTRNLSSVSLKNLGRLRFVQRAISILRLRHWPGYRRCVALIDRIVLRKAQLHDLTVPSDVAERLDAGYQGMRRKILGRDV